MTASATLTNPAVCTNAYTTNTGANLFNSTPGNPNGTAAAGSTVVTCSAFSNVPANSYISRVVLSYYADYQAGSLTQSNDVQLTFNASPANALSFVPNPTTIDVMGGFSSTSTKPSPLPAYSVAAYYAMGTQAINAFNVSIASAVLTGAVSGSSAVVLVQYDIVSSVPEPASYAMIGAGLLVLAGFARRRK